MYRRPVRAPAAAGIVDSGKMPRMQADKGRPNDPTPAGPTPGPVERVADDDPRVTPFRSLRDPDLVRAGEGRGWFIGEQLLVLERMLARPGTTISILASERMAERARRLRDASDDPAPPLLVADDAVIESIVGFDLHRGLLALGRRPADGLARLERRIADRSRPVSILACEEIRNIDNIGLLFRNAAAFGVDGVLLSPGCHDPLYRKSLRVSIGHALDIPFARLEPWPEALGAFCREFAVRLIGAATDSVATPLGRVDPSARTALLVGSEFPGLAGGTKTGCDELVRIPMAPGVDSLNVAVASAVCLARLREPWLERAPRREA